MKMLENLARTDGSWTWPKRVQTIAQRELIARPMPNTQDSLTASLMQGSRRMPSIGGGAQNHQGMDGEPGWSLRWSRSTCSARRGTNLAPAWPVVFASSRSLKRGTEPVPGRRLPAISGPDGKDQDGHAPQVSHRHSAASAIDRPHIARCRGT
mmetsp:Transcript_114897/g.366545  ORF Transcript_114897/g.366545 Transcript_114897/m.366545 type:complete len:153 (-) Transcript_114897:13-471(-)